MSDFDRELERELDRILRPFDGASFPAWRPPAPLSGMKKVLGGAGAAIAAKLVTGFVVTALAAAGAGVATEAAITGSLNPAVWGHQVNVQVTTCQAALSAAQHGIGDCVSAFAAQRGAARSVQNEAGSGTQKNGPAKAKSNSNHGNNQGQGQQGQGNKTHEHPPWVRD
jgi:hypothetical protein